MLISTSSVSFIFEPFVTFDQKTTMTLQRQLPSSLVSCQLDYANLVLYVIIEHKTTTTVQNGLARIVAHLTSHSPISPTLKKLHWLPIKHPISNKFATLTCKVLEFGEPAYLSSRIIIFIQRRELRSSTNTQCLNTERTVIAGHAFCSSSPAIWNIYL